jgi:hypothetical protein
MHGVEFIGFSDIQEQGGWGSIQSILQVPWQEFFDLGETFHY